MENTTAVILAAGMGTRMRTTIPKVLHEAGGRSMLERVYCSLKSAGIPDIVAVIGYKADMIEGLFREQMRFVRQPELLGSGDALAHAVDFMSVKEDPVLVTCGDTPLISASTYEKMVKAYLRQKASCVLLTAEVEDTSSYGRIIRDRDGHIERIVEEKDLLPEERKIKEVNVGTYCFNKAELRRYIREIELNEKKKEFYLTDIVDILRKKGGKIVSVKCPTGEHIGVNSRKDLAKVNKMFYRRKADKLMDAGVTITDPSMVYIDDSAVIGRDTTILPGTIIESGVRVGTGCRIGPSARLRPGTYLKNDVEVGNFVEICRSEIGSGTKIKHHAYIGDSTVGKNVNIGAGVITANYDGKAKHRTIVSDGVFLGVGALLVAPVRIGSRSVVGAGSVVLKNSDIEKDRTVAGVPAADITTKRKGI